MKYKVIISERAKEMLGMHVRFMAHVNKSAAEKLKKRVLDEMRSLQEIPANKYHKLYVENWYLILYQIKDDIVYIDWIVDCRQDYQWLLQ